jgi:hypothetical protein
MARGGSGSGSGGGFGSGLGLGVGAVAVNTCPIDNQTLFCKFSRLFQVISWIFSIFVFLVITYFFIKVFFFSKGGKTKLF